VNTKKSASTGGAFFLLKCFYMKMSISVMAHPARKEFFDYLKSKLGDVPFSIDEGKGLIWNCRNAWSMYDPLADYHVVIQDDAIVCDNFMERAQDILKKAQGLPVSFFHVSPLSYKKYREQREKTGAIIQPKLSGGVALCLPVALISSMLEHYDQDKSPFDDERVGRFLLSIKTPLYFPFPSLIDHRIGNRSMMWKSASSHKANEYIDAN
jgi:hypothetical protein